LTASLGGDNSRASCNSANLVHDAVTVQQENRAMPRAALDPPLPDEYATFYSTYISRIRDGDPIARLRRQPAALRAACAGMIDEESLHRYAPAKWSIKEVLGHLSDAERIFAYRLLRISRGDVTPLSGFDENTYVEAANFDDRPLASLVENFGAARASTLALIDGLSAEELARSGVANGAPISARAIVYILAGHVEHHFGLLRDRYGVFLPE